MYANPFIWWLRSILVYLSKGQYVPWYLGLCVFPLRLSPSRSFIALLPFALNISKLFLDLFDSFLVASVLSSVVAASC